MHSKPISAYELLKRDGNLERARTWLRKNPKPVDFRGTQWDWAALEMPVPAKIARLAGVAVLSLGYWLATRKQRNGATTDTDKS